jgi:hypothetical protein
LPSSKVGEVGRRAGVDSPFAGEHGDRETFCRCFTKKKEVERKGGMSGGGEVRGWVYCLMMGKAEQLRSAVPRQAVNPSTCCVYFYCSSPIHIHHVYYFVKADMTS